MWQVLNAQYFDGRLPAIDIQWSSRLTSSVGMFVSQTGPRSRFVSYEERHGSARKIRLSLPLLADMPHSEIRGTLAHEMIHQWQYDIRKRRPSHGADFSHMKDLMNGDGLGITVCHSLIQEVEAFTRYEWRCQSCGKGYRRQRRTIFPARHRCSECLGSLKEVVLSQPEQPDKPSCGPVPPGVRWGLTEHSGSPLQLSFNFSME
jgi:predicted SprT family Zn-dependent metalloprotease